MENGLNKKELELDSFEVVACKDKNLRSFLNVFHFKEENLSKDQMGEIFGAIQVFDYSEQSAYLPNLIAQVIKKEFFMNTKLSSEESFEKALKKANVALSDLTRHEVVGWMGKLHAVIGIIQGNNFFFTQAGGGKILLIRDKKINEISRGLDDSEGNHPMKTFSNVSSGKLELDDKVLFATESLFDSLSWEDLKRHAKTFNSSEFDNLVKSTLEVEGENVGALIVNIKERQLSPLPSLPRRKSSKGQNFFGKDDDAKKKTKKKKGPTTPEATKGAGAKEVKKEDEKGFPEKQEDEKEQKEKNKKNLSPFERQPELFIKEGDVVEFDSEKQAANNVLERIKGALEKTKDDGAEIVSKIKKTKKEHPQKEQEVPKKEGPKKQPTKEDPIKSIRIEEKTVIPEEKKPKPKVIKTAKKEGVKKTKKPDKKIEISPPQTPTAEKGEVLLEKRKKDIHQGLSAFYEQPSEEKKGSAKSKKDLPKIWQEKSLETITEVSKKKTKRTALKEFVANNAYQQKIKEGFSRHKDQYSHEIKTLKNKIKKSELAPGDILRSRYIFSTAVVIFIGILLFIFFLKKGPSGYSTISNPQQQQTEQDPNQNTYITEKGVEARTIGQTDSNIIDIAGYRNDVYAITENRSFYRYDSHVNEFGGVPLGDDINNVVSMVSMPVLNLIFFVSNDSVYSYSPVLDRFDKHNIKMPANADIIDSGVHSSLSSLYIFDRNSGQIYRYPRAEGGFNPPFEWFKQAISTDNVTGFAIDDGIRITYGDGTIEYYYQKELENTFLIDIEPRVIPQKIETDNNTDYYYILDKENPRVLKINKQSNAVENEYWNEKFQDAKNLSIHEDREGYVVTKDNEILKFEL